jgi:hypothetical protein
VNLVIDGTRHRMTHVHRGVWAVPHRDHSRWLCASHR